MSALPLWQLIAVLAVPTFAVLLRILLNQKSVDRLADRIDRQGDRTDHRMERLENELNRRMERLENELRDFRKQMHDQYVGLLGMMGDHGQRIVPLEQR
jgi:hypothetical protein